MTDEIIEPTSLQFYPSQPRYESIIRYSNSKNEFFVIRVSSENPKVLEELANNLTVTLELFEDENSTNLFSKELENVSAVEVFSETKLDEIRENAFVDEVSKDLVEFSIEEIQFASIYPGNVLISLPDNLSGTVRPSRIRLPVNKTDCHIINQQPRDSVNLTISAVGKIKAVLLAKNNSHDWKKVLSKESSDGKIHIQHKELNSLFKLCLTATISSSSYTISGDITIAS